MIEYELINERENNARNVVCDRWEEKLTGEDIRIITEILQCVLRGVRRRKKE